MPKTLNVPAGATHVRTYDELDPYADAFARGAFGLWVVIGDSGVGKSQRIRRALAGKARFVEGNASAFQTYIELFQNRDEPLVLDDVGGWDLDAAWVNFLKCLCQSDEEKTVAWLKHTPALDHEGVPRSFTTRSKVAIICNGIKERNGDVPAVLDRGQVVVFDPPPVAVHVETAKWFRDQEIFDYIGGHLHLAPRISMRHYHKAAELKKAGIDWRNALLGWWELAPMTVTVARLQADPTLSEEERKKVFTDGRHGSRSSYFVHLKKLRPALGVTVPHIVLGDPL